MIMMMCVDIINAPVIVVSFEIWSDNQVTQDIYRHGKSY